jgi:hypothetical protein
MDTLSFYSIPDTALAYGWTLYLSTLCPCTYFVYLYLMDGQCTKCHSQGSHCFKSERTIQSVKTNRIYVCVEGQWHFPFLFRVI